VHSRRCYEQLAASDGLSAENALYRLGVIESRLDGNGRRAVLRWSEYARRFPSGVLAPEAQLSLLSALVSDGRQQEARGAADDFLLRFPDDGRAAQVRRIRDSLH
jgi:outer membrane protein assembly factor BamD (BamD/ComL family)